MLCGAVQKNGPGAQGAPWLQGLLVGPGVTETATQQPELEGPTLDADADGGGMVPDAATTSRGVLQLPGGTGNIGELSLGLIPGPEGRGLKAAPQHPASTLRSTAAWARCGWGQRELGDPCGVAMRGRVGEDEEGQGFSEKERATVP